MDGHPEVVQMVEAFFQAKLEARFDGFESNLAKLFEFV